MQFSSTTRVKTFEFRSVDWLLHTIFGLAKLQKMITVTKLSDSSAYAMLGRSDSMDLGGIAGARAQLGAAEDMGAKRK